MAHGPKETAEAARRALETEAVLRDGGVPTFGSLIAEQELMEELPEALDTLCTAIWYAFSYQATESGQDPKALITQSLTEFGNWATNLVDEATGSAEAKKSAAEELIEKVGRVLSSKNETDLQAAVELIEKVLEQVGAPMPDEGGKETPTTKAICYTVTKRDEDLRRTTGVLYTPMEKDSHGEYATQQDLEDAVAEYVKAGDLAIRKQHDTDVVIGTTIGIIAWPEQETVTLKNGGGAERTVTLPAGTVYQSVEWTPEAWPDVKADKIAGYSLGGTAVRVRNGAADSELESMGE